MDTLKRLGRKKIFFIVTGILMVIHLVTLFVVTDINKSFKLEGERFRYLSEEDDLIVFKDRQGNLLKAIIEDKNPPLPPDAMFNKYRLVYMDQTVGIDYSDWLHGDVVISLANQEEYRYEYLSFHYYPPSNAPKEIKMINKFEETYSFITAKPLAASPFFGLFFILMGLGLVIYPERVWRFQHMFTVEGGQATEWAIFSNRLVGFILAFIGTLLPALPFLQN